MEDIGYRHEKDSEGKVAQRGPQLSSTCLMLSYTKDRFGKIILKQQLAPRENSWRKKLDQLARAEMSKAP